MAISQAKRQELLTNGICVVCDAGMNALSRERDKFGRWRAVEPNLAKPFDNVYHNLTIDHIVPRAYGGTNHRFNLMVLCEKCNTNKGDKDPVDWLYGLDLASEGKREALRIMILAAIATYNNEND